MMIIIVLVVVTAAPLMVLLLATLVVVGIVVSGTRWILTSSVRVVIRASMVQHFPVPLQLDLDLAIDELEEAMLIHLVVEVVGLVCPFFKPRSRHLKLVMEVMTRVQHLLWLLGRMWLVGRWRVVVRLGWELLLLLLELMLLLL